MDYTFYCQESIKICKLSNDYYINNNYIDDYEINNIYMELLFLFRKNNILLENMPTINYIEHLYKNLPENLRSLNMIFNILTKLTYYDNFIYSK